jgi:monoamine oxidase
MAIPFSRRAVLAAPVILTATRAMSAEVDLVIVGAGAAGLSAAKTAQVLGLSFVLIEARDRIGGRTVTDTALGAPFDGGATFIHFSEKNPWTKIAEDLGIDAPLGGWRGAGFREFRDGVPLEPGDPASGASGRGKLWALTEEIDEESDVSFARLVEKAPPEVAAAAHSLSRGAVGEEPERVSVADYSRLYDGGNRVVPSGYGALVARYGADVPVRLGVAATTIDWRGAGVTVRTAVGDIKAQKAVITVPIGVLKAERIAFNPPLPNEMTRALDGLAMGALSKIGLKFEGNRFGAPAGMFYSEVRSQQPGVSYEMFPWDRDIVVGWYGADYAREINRLGADAAADHFLERLVKIVGADARKHFKGARRYGWSEDPFSIGSYSYAKPGQAKARDTLRRPVGERLWFAGEAMAGRASMTVAGAHQTGEQAVRAIAARLRGRKG